MCRGNSRVSSAGGWKPASYLCRHLQILAFLPRQQACCLLCFQMRASGGIRLALRFSAESFHQILNQCRQFRRGHQNKVGVKRLSEIFLVNIFILVGRSSSPELQPFD